MGLIKLANVVVIILVAGVALSSEIVRPAPTARRPAGKIVGVILDAYDARVVNATVKVEGGQIKREVESSDEGDFEISLPAGSYQMTIEANGFRRFIYSPLKVKQNETEMINIHLKVAVPRGLVPAFSIGG